MNLPRFLAVALVVAAAALVWRYGPLRRFEIAEVSMAPTLRPGDYVVTVRRRPRRGAIVVFEHPERRGFRLSKRVVGLPGEQVSIAEGLVLIDGFPLDEPWAHHHLSPEGSWTVPPRHVFVLGDDRLRSRADSRFLGPVPVGGLDEIVWRYHPLRRRGEATPGFVSGED